MIRPRAAHVTVTTADGTTWTEIFSAEDISSRLCASRVRALVGRGYDVTRYDFRVGSVGDPAVLAAIPLDQAISLVTADHRESFPEYTPAEAVASVRNNLVLPEKAPKGFPQHWVLHPHGGAGDPVYWAYRAVLEASDAELRLIRHI